MFRHTIQIKSFFISLMVAFISFTGYGEGTKQLLPDSTVSGAGLFIDPFSSDGYTMFGLPGSPQNYRLCIHVKNPGEWILFGMNAAGYNPMTFNLRKPDGTVALTGSCPVAAGQTGFIRYYHQAIVGPFPAQGGYIPFQFHIASIADTGDYYFEFTNLPPFSTPIIDYWDYQVV